MSKKLMVVVVFLCGALACLGQTESLPYSFVHSDGENNPTAYILYSSGCVIGTAPGAIANYQNGRGSVYKLCLSGGTWTKNVIWTVPYASATPLDHPTGQMVLDGSGNIYGASAGTGASGESHGAVWKLTNNNDGTYSESTLHNFHSDSGTYGGTPLGGVVGSAYFGAVFAAMNEGGANNLGTIFELSGSGPADLYDFDDCSHPVGPMAWLDTYTLVGTTSSGGLYGGGCLFTYSLLAPDNSPYQVRYYFGNTGDGATPLGQPLVAGGYVYVTTSAGGSAGDGTLVSFDTTNYTETLIHSFTADTTSPHDGALPQGNIITDGTNLFLTTTWGGANGNNHSTGGTLIEFAPSGGSWTETILYNFAGYTGDAYDVSPGIVGVSGKIYGTSYFGGSDADGTLWLVQ